ncbi:hypothetical protein BN1723_006362 [Verticillium longisporum]|uniref:Uncharacterized protein n=1 Tax=Verticillium longisporum TaxID=100787 RepID=A0A0G4NEA5_VERLO|nr:hypothetical protein BN1723_006362 [Verticillium longisporum]
MAATKEIATRSQTSAVTIDPEQSRWRGELVVAPETDAATSTMEASFHSSDDYHVRSHRR